MTINPLVAGRLDQPTNAWAGVWIAEDIEAIAQGVENRSWVDGTLGVVGAGLDALALVSDPVGALLQYGISWLIEHVKPLSEALDWLAGDPGQIAAHAQTWRNVASSLRAESDELAKAARLDLTEWQGAAAEAYGRWASDRDRSLQALAKASDTLALITEGAGMLIGTVRMMVRDAVATVVSRLIVYAGELIATAGLATPVVAEQVSTLCASWAAKITRWLKSLLSSLRNLGRDSDKLTNLIERLRRAGGDDIAVRARQTGGELRRPRDDADFELRWADEAYDKIRAADDVAAVAETAGRHGFGHEDIQLIKNHVFYEEHLLDHFPPGEMGRFDSSGRMAEAWQRLAGGDPHPSDLDLLAHERYEARYMESTGDPSYERAHAATNEAGYTWDPDAAARDGLGFQPWR
jgi:uncharacterized protein YukE